MRRAPGEAAASFGVALAVVVALPLGTAAVQQDPPVRPKVPLSFATEARTVNLTVTVRGLDGKLLRDLTAKDFTVFEDDKPQNIQFFARVFDPSRSDDEGQEGAPDPTAIDLGMLFDTSSSMADVLKLSQNAATQFLESIPRARELTTVFFDSDIRLSRFTGESQQGLFDRLQKSKSGGDTLLYDSIAVYLSRISDDPGRKIVVIFTDGEDSKSLVTISELKDLVRSSTVTIYPILFGGKYENAASGLKARSHMGELAELTGGEVFTPRSFKDLQPIYDGLLDELAAQYVIGYVPQGDDSPGERRLRVEVNRPGTRARHRRGYRIAPPERNRRRRSRRCPRVRSRRQRARPGSRLRFASVATFDEFLNLDLRVGTVLKAEPLEGAIKPAYRMEIDFGAAIGTKRSSGQYTVNYRPEDLVGRQIIAVVNFPPRRIAGFMSEVLVLAAPDSAGAHVLLSVERPVPNGGRIS